TITYLVLLISTTLFFFIFYRYGAPLVLHPFPTRRSSDLVRRALALCRPSLRLSVGNRAAACLDSRHADESSGDPLSHHRDPCPQGPAPRADHRPQLPAARGPGPRGRGSRFAAHGAAGDGERRPRDRGVRRALHGRNRRDREPRETRAHSR